MTLTFQGQILNSLIPGMEWPIDMEQKQWNRGRIPDVSSGVYGWHYWVF